MAHTAAVFDVTDAPDLRRLAEEVRDTGEPRVLQVEGRDIAILLPTATTNDQDQRRRQADDEAFFSSFGGWQGIVDGEQLKRDLAAARGSDRPPVEL